jgi:very-short-patch-repair endonuclease
MTERNNIPIRNKISSGIVTLQFVDEHKKEQSRSLRKNSTLAEKTLWKHLRNHQLNGYKFRRQQIIEGFIVDFYCEEANLVIEADGEIHNTEKKSAEDKHKDNVLSARGLYILRLKNEQILNQTEKVLLEIRNIADKRISK